jgi:hypothetical protein
VSFLWPVIYLLGLLSLLTGCNSDQPMPATAEVFSAGLRVTITRVATHPFLARYDLKLRMDGPNTCSASTDLFPDTGGVSRRNLYQMASGRIYVLGQFDLRAVDASACTIRLVEFRSLAKDITFLGTFDENEQGRWTFLPATVRAERLFERL